MSARAEVEPEAGVIRKPYLLLVADQTSPVFAKTGQGLRDWCPDDCVGQMRFSADAVDLGLPDMDVAAAAAAGARTVVVGVALPGGGLPESWTPTLLALLDAGLDIASGLHVPLEAVPALAERAKALGRRLHNVRLASGEPAIGTGAPRSGKRMLMVGTDCAVGKKYTALAITRMLQKAGMKATFRATGQTGILIAGRGTAVDAVKADFISGAAEALSPGNDPDHWDIIEGQGSLFHPSFAAVTLGLVHGSQPDLMVLCHQSGRAEIAGLSDYKTPGWQEAIGLYTQVARLTNQRARVAAISLNCNKLPEAERQTALEQIRAETGLPTFDPMAWESPAELMAELAGA